MLLPVDEIGRGGDADGVGLAVVLGVGEDVALVGWGAVRGFDETWVFDAAGPLARLLGVVGGEEDGLGEAGEVEAVGAGGKAEARGVAADLHGAGVVFRAIEDEDLSVANDRGGVEGVECFPVDGLVGDGIGEGGGGQGRENGSGEGTGEGAERWQLCLRFADAGNEEREGDDAGDATCWLMHMLPLPSPTHLAQNLQKIAVRSGSQP